ncbi:MAG: pyridoxamine 5'-phosphate oxidase family protein [Acetobacteraceae bacterium]|nr:pyridoxamine 5'-phosphate oxidase family protein [Acetobacteraceae bacterium]
MAARYKNMTLDEVRADAFRRLAHGAAHRRSPFRAPALATANGQGLPGVRTVVLRGFDPATRTLTLHSDVRTAKIEEIRTEPRVVLHTWDGRGQVQVRVWGRAALRLGEAARGDWSRLHPVSRTTYAVAPTPGTPLDDPASADQQRLPGSEAFLNFAVIEVVMDSLDWLHLARTGHRRARFTWLGGTETASWLVP